MEQISPVYYILSSKKEVIKILKKLRKAIDRNAYQYLKKKKL